MSTSKGNSSRSRPQKHQNRTAFKNDLHDTSNKTKLINSLDINGVCKRCKDIIEWKIKYKKYKPLTAPRKCVNCKEKNVKHAYHVMCFPCVKSKNICAKCCKNVEVIPAAEIEDNQDDEVQTILKSLPERKRRTLIRYINKNQNEMQTLNSDENKLALKLEKLKSSSRGSNTLDDFNSSSEESSDSDCGRK